MVAGRVGSRALAQALQQPLRIPMIASPLFIVSTPELVIEQCLAGVVGSFPALNARGPKKENALDEWLCRIKASLPSKSMPFAVNQIVHKSNGRLAEDMEIIAKHKVPIVITSLGARADINDAVHAYGGVVFHDVINETFARKAIDKGADGLILVASGAGGHAGTQSPFAMVEQIRQFFDGPVALAGALGSGRSVAAAIAAGADFGYVGSPFIATNEANAADAYKRAVVEARGAEDIVYSNLFTGVWGNYLRSSVRNAGLDPDALPVSDPSKMDFAAADAKAW